MRYELRHRMKGMSLVELMVGVTLGLFLLAGVASVFTSTGQTNRSNQNLARLQESARTAFSVMSRDIREAGLNDCGRVDKITNVLNNSTVDPMLNWEVNRGVLGYAAGTASPGVVSGAGVGQRVSTEDAIHIMSGGATGLVVASHNPAGSFTLGSPSTFATGDLAIICDFGVASILQLGASAGTTVNYAVGGAGPGNCSIGLDRSNTPCVTPKLTTYLANSTLMQFRSVIWYVGNNDRADSGGRSLYRMRLVNTGGSNAAIAEEIMEGVSGLQFQYLVSGAANYVAAGAVPAASWPNVVAVRVNVTLSGVEREASASGAAARVQRTFTNVVALRNRVS